MRNLENIDEFFSDRLSQHEENVPPYIWDNIADKLNHKRKQKTLFYIRSAAASVAVLIAFFAGYYLTNNTTNNQFVSENNIENQQINTSENKSTNEIGSAKTLDFISEESPTDNVNQINELNEKNTKQADVDNSAIMNGFDNSKNINTNYGVLAQEGNVVNENNSEKRDMNFLQRLFRIDFNEFETEIKQNEIVYPDKILLAYVDLYGIEDNEDVTKENVNKWLLGGSVSPVYSYRNTGSQSNMYSDRTNYFGDANLPNSSESGVVSYAGGVNVGYKINKRLNVYSGIYYSETGQVSNDVHINEYQSSASEPLEINTSMGDIRTNYSSYNLVNSVSANFSAPMDNIDEWTSNSTTINSKVYQFIDFIEVPLLLKYKVIDRRLGMHFLGGVSTSFVVGNESLLEYDNNKYDLGQTENIQAVNYNSTVGLGFEYLLTENLSMSLEPTFKYAMNSINTAYKVFPYSFAVFTGLNYKF